MTRQELNLIGKKLNLNCGGEGSGTPGPCPQSGFAPKKTFGGWIAEGSLSDGTLVEYGKMKPITRRSQSYFFLKVGEIEKRFKLGAGVDPKQKFETAVKKLRIPFNEYRD